MSLLAGTSGYSYPEWKGTLYPSDARPEDFLSLYAARFSTVEINQTFYRFPTVTVLESWLEQTPESFRFSIKANKRITHTRRLRGTEQVVREFIERCELLGDRLGPMLFQLPPQLRRDDSRLDTFLHALQSSGTRHHRHVLEFRHPSWLHDDVFARLRDANVAMCLAEDLCFADANTAPVTAKHVYIRLRRATYSASDLACWRRWIDVQLADGREVYVYLKHEGGSSPMETLNHFR